MELGSHLLLGVEGEGGVRQKIAAYSGATYKIRFFSICGHRIISISTSNIHHQVNCQRPIGQPTHPQS